jgi:hypothetical protein
MGDQRDAPALELDPAIHSVEFKFTVSAADEKLVEAGLHEPRLEPMARKIWFFDSDDLALFDAHVVLRARATEGAGEDTTVKLRPVVPAAVDPAWTDIDGFEIQLDVVGADPQPSAKLDADQDPGELADVVAGRRALDRLFSADQERFLHDLARIGEPLAAVSPRGPIDVQRWTLEPDLLTEKVTVERWVMPAGDDFVELSIKAKPADADQAGRAFRAWLAHVGLDASAPQESKTRKVLEAFTRPGSP